MRTCPSCQTMVLEAIDWKSSYCSHCGYAETRLGLSRDVTDDEVAEFVDMLEGASDD